MKFCSAWVNVCVECEISSVGSECDGSGEHSVESGVKNMHRAELGVGVGHWVRYGMRTNQCCY